MPSSAASSPQPESSPKKFLTPTRIVVTFLVIGLGLAVWLTSCNSTDQGKTANANGAPANSTVVVKPGNPPKPPPTLPISLPSDVRDAHVKTVDGDSLKLSDYDQKVVVLNIWATWCGPCRQEMPDLVKLNQEYKSRGLVVLGLATTYNERNGPDYVKEFIKKQNIDYKILWDDGTLAQPLVQMVGGRSVIPQSFVITRDGRIVKHFQGYNPLSTPALMRQAVEDALSDKGKA